MNHVCTCICRHTLKFCGLPQEYVTAKATPCRTQLIGVLKLTLNNKGKHGLYLDNILALVNVSNCKQCSGLFSQFARNRIDEMKNHITLLKRNIERLGPKPEHSFPTSRILRIWVEVQKSKTNLGSARTVPQVFGFYGLFWRGVGGRKMQNWPGRAC